MHEEILWSKEEQLLSLKEENDFLGVTILLEATDKELDTFLYLLKTKTPPLATIDKIKLQKQNYKAKETING